MDPEPFEARGRGPRRQRDLLGTDDGALAHLLYWLARGSVELLGRAPRPLRAAVVELLARLARRMLRARSDAARAYIDQALGPGLEPRRREALVLAAYRNLANVAIEAPRLPDVLRGADLASRFELEPHEGLERVLAERAPVVFVMPHVGAWEAPGFLWQSLGFERIYAIGKPTKNRPLSRWIQSVRDRYGQKVLSRYGAIQEATRVVAEGASLGLLLDHRAINRPLYAPFFGRPARCERSSAVLLRRLKKPVVVFACYRAARPFHYRIRVARVLSPEEIAAASPEELVGAINAALEELILAAPEQYYWLHDRFKNTPATFEEAGLESPGATPARAGG